MPHFILCPFGSSGDVFPFISMGRVLRTRGHDVTVLSMDVFESAIRGAGLRYESMGTREEFDRLAGNPKLWQPIRGSHLVFQIAAQAVRPAFEKIKAIIRPGEQTMLVTAGTFFGARLAREKLGVPQIVVHLQPAAFLSVYDTPVFLEGRRS